MIYNLHQAQRQEMNSGSGSAETKFSSNDVISITCHGVTQDFPAADLKKFYQESMKLCEYTKRNTRPGAATFKLCASLQLLRGVSARNQDHVCGNHGFQDCQHHGGANQGHQLQEDWRKKPHHRKLCTGAGYKPTIRNNFSLSYHNVQWNCS